MLTEHLVDVRREGLGSVDMTAGGHPGQHALDDQRVEQVGRAEDFPRVEGDLLTAGRPAPGPLRGDRPTAEHHRAGRRPVPCPARSPAAILACFNPTRPSNSAFIIWAIATNPVADANANTPSFTAPATSASATVASSYSPTTRAAYSACAPLTTATFFFTVVPFLWVLGRARSLPVGRSQPGSTDGGVGGGAGVVSGVWGLG